MKAELDRAQLVLQQERTQAELEKVKADLAHQQELHRMAAQRRNWGDRMRSAVLLLVVLAVVATPIFAMGVGGMPAVPPEQFSQYVAPVTAITGTILGYWFGRSSDNKN